MTRTYFLETKRIGFSKWKDEDEHLAMQLWGAKKVTRYLCTNGVMEPHEIKERLRLEINNDKQHSMQYWPVFELQSGMFIGCCGLRPFCLESHIYELGIHLQKQFWGSGYAFEIINAIINYSFEVLKAKKLYAGHHPDNIASRQLLTKVGFQYIGRNYYEPTGLYHPSYFLDR